MQIAVGTKLLSLYSTHVYTWCYGFGLLFSFAARTITSICIIVHSVHASPQFFTSYFPLISLGLSLYQVFLYTMGCCPGVCLFFFFLLPFRLRRDSNVWLRVLLDSDHRQIAVLITDPSSRQRGRPKTKSKAIFRQKKGKSKLWS
jgi:hypothetical protein